MIGLVHLDLTIVLCTLTNIEAIFLSDSKNSLEFTTRDVYGSWIMSEESSQPDSSDDNTQPTKSIFRKYYWVTPLWMTTKKISKRSRKMTGRYSSRSRDYESKRPRGRPRLNTTRHPISGRWPTYENGSRYYSVKPGFGRPRKSNKSRIPGETKSGRRGPTKWTGTSRTSFVKTFTTFTGSRRIRRVNTRYRERLSPYFRWHTQQPNGIRQKISRGSRGSYGTRKPPRPNRFKWLSGFHSTKRYVGNLTCRLFIMRSRTTLLLFTPFANSTNTTMSDHTDSFRANDTTTPIISHKRDSDQTYEDFEESGTSLQSSTSHKTTTTSLDTVTSTTDIPLTDSTSLYIPTISTTNFTVSTTPLTSSLQPYDIITDFTFRLMYTPVANP